MFNHILFNLIQVAIVSIFVTLLIPVLTNYPLAFAFMGDMLGAGFILSHFGIFCRLLSEAVVVPERLVKLAPEAGLEPATTRLTAACSTIELLWIANGRAIYRPPCAASNGFSRAQQINHLLVAGLQKIFIVLADCLKINILKQNQNFVGNTPQLFGGLRRSDRRGD